MCTCVPLGMFVHVQYMNKEEEFGAIGRASEREASTWGPSSLRDLDTSGRILILPRAFENEWWS